MIVRDAYFSEIYELTKLGEDIVIVSADLGAPSLAEIFHSDLLVSVLLNRIYYL